MTHRPSRARHRLVNVAAALLLATWSASGVRLVAQSPQAAFDRAVTAFREGRLEDSAAAFDEVVRLSPGDAPYLWQRGIVLYYVGRYDDCRTQFESHRTVNPNDVENATWHFVCVARAESPDAARAALLPVGPDQRVPMTEIYQMFTGEITPAEVLTAAGGEPRAVFYAELYVGLYLEAQGDAAAAEHIRKAADPRYADAGGYMQMVARVHADMLD
jgi:tetratricopeptide (TPR) repeat protein